MKINKLILTGILATTLMGTSFAANDMKDSTAIELINDDQTPKEIQLSELPQAVQDTLKANAYQAEKAFILYKDEQAIYQVEALSAGEKVILYYDAIGNEVKG